MATLLQPRTRSPLMFPDRVRRSRDRELSLAKEKPASVAAGLSRISVAVVHHNEISREGLKLLLAQQPDIVVRGSYAGELAGLRETQPDVILLSLGSQDRDGVRNATAVLAAAPRSRVVVIGLLGVSVDLACLAQAGVFGFVLESATSEELLRTVRSVARGMHVWPPAIAKTLFSQLAREGGERESSARSNSPRMTPREREVMALIADGLRTKEIALRLGVASFTVRAHVRNIMEKLNMHTRLQIAAHVYREREGQLAFAAPPAERGGPAPVARAAIGGFAR
jgi:DNA-binding NarL/FixJ family response regulator